MEKDLTYGTDLRGDSALFIEQKHFNNDWELDQEAKAFTENKLLTFFRVINNGQQKSSHGWIDKGEIVQWG